MSGGVPCRPGVGTVHACVSGRLRAVISTTRG